MRYERIGLFMRVVKASKYSRVRVSILDSADARRCLRQAPTYQGVLWCCDRDRPLFQFTVHRSSESA